MSWASPQTGRRVELAPLTHITSVEQILLQPKRVQHYPLLEYRGLRVNKSTPWGLMLLELSTYKVKESSSLIGLKALLRLCCHILKGWTYWSLDHSMPRVGWLPYPKGQHEIIISITSFFGVILPLHKCHDDHTHTHSELCAADRAFMLPAWMCYLLEARLNLPPTSPRCNSVVG